MKTLILTFSILISVNTFATTQFECVGTEPFWSLKTTDKMIKIQDPINLKGDSLEIISRKSAAQTSEDYATVIKSKYISLSILRGECNDGMSDEIYNFSVIVDKGDTVLAGCCNPIK